MRWSKKSGCSKDLQMEYRGIRYTIRARIERHEWTVSIHPADIESPRKVITGPRERAELVARSMIDRWYERASQSVARGVADTIGGEKQKA
jgi:hypothetical protein